MKTKNILVLLLISLCAIYSNAQFTSGRIVAVQTTGATTKYGSAVTLKEYTTTGSAGTSITLPNTGENPIQMAATLGGSEGYISQSTDGTSLVFGGYATTANYSATDITVSTASTAPRAIYKVDGNGSYSKIYSSTTAYSANDIRAAISDGTNYWAGGASVASVDGINYFGPSTAVNFGATGTPIKAYGLRIFNGQMYYSTQKAGPSNTTSQLGIFSVGTGLPISGSPTLTQVINTGTTIPSDFSFNSTSTICYVAVNLNSATGGIQKWTKSGSTWTLQYTLGTGVSNIGAFGLVVDYSGDNPVLYATTSEATVGNRIIKITDSGSGSSATTLVAAATNVWFHGLDFAPCTAPSIASISSSAVCQGNTLALNLSTTGTNPVTYAWTGPNSFTSSSQNPSISNATTDASGTYSVNVTNSCGSANSTVTGTVNALPTATITPSGSSTFCSGNSVTLTASAGYSYLWSTNETTQAITVSTSGSYSVTVTNASNCSATSSNTSVTVNSTVTPSVSIASNNGASICSGSSVTFTATPTNGGSSPVYQWKLNGVNTGSNSATLTTSSLNSNDVISCDMTSNATCTSTSTVSSNSITMTVTQSVTPTISISSDNGSTICAATPTTFTASQTNGGNSPSYQWKKNGFNTGSNSATYTSNSLTNNDVISCVLTSNNSCASEATATSNSITMVVNSINTPSISIASNIGNSICTGVNTTFTATTNFGGNTPTYQWKVNGSNIGNNSATFSSTSLANNDAITCDLTSNATCLTSSTATSNSITLTVNSLPNPSISGTTSICAGNTTTLDAGAGYVSYLWSNGATTQTISTGVAGNYSVTVLDATCSNTSTPVTINVNTVPNQPSTFTSSTSIVSKGQSGVVYAITNDPLVTYNWTYTGGVGATINGSGNLVTLNFSANATSGTLHVSATNTCGTGTERTIDITVNSSDFTPGKLVVLQTNGTVSKAATSIVLKEIATDGTPGVTVSLPNSGPTPIQTAGVYGGSGGFLSTSSDGKFLVVAGYASASAFTDVTGTLSSVVPRVVGKVTPSGQYQQVATSTTFFSANDIRSAISDGTNFWIGGGSAANVDGINYIAPNSPVALGTSATPPKAYGLRIFNGQIYYSTQKVGPTNTTSQLGIFAIGSGLPTSGSVTSTQIINTGTIIPQDFSFNSSLTTCYIAVSLNTAAGGIQKWTKSGATWSLQYTLGTGTTNIGAFGLYVDYSNTNPILYATTFEAAGNRVIKITDTGAGSTATTIVNAVSGTFYKGISFAPSDSGIPTVNLSVSASSGTEVGTTAITVTATASSTLSSSETVSLAVTGTNITSGDYTLSNTTITIPSGASSGSVTFTVVDDVASEGTETATLTISNPSQGLLIGSTISQNIVISDNDNTAPTIAINIASTSNYIDRGIASSPVSPYTISGSKGDVTDPLTTLGIDFVINDAETVASSLIVTVASSNTAVVPNGSLTLSGASAIRNLKIAPSSVGYSTITIQVSDGISNASYVLNYAASDSIPKINLTDTRWHTGMSDASDAIALDNDYYMTADDEVDLINVYSRNNSGLPVASFDYSSYLNLPDLAKPEVDAEASARSYKIANRYYWLGSMSNGKDPFDNKPNRDRLFATTVTGTGATTSISVNGYSAIRSSLLTWGDAYGYNFTASAAAGVDSKAANGFAAEGMVFGPDSTTLWIGLRAPLVPTANRTKAVIAPILNFETWFNNGSQVGNPTFGAPIELNLGGKGIRDIIRLSNGSYIIVAGDAGPNLALSSIYKWTGNTVDAPILVSTKGDGKLNMEGVMEVKTNGITSMSQLQVLSDGGSDVIYNDGLVAKDYGNLNLRKFRSDVLTSLDLCMPLAPSIVALAQGTETFCPNFPIPITAKSIPSEVSFLWNTGATTKTIGIPSFSAYSCTTIDAYGCSYTSYSKTVSNLLKSDFNADGVNNVIDFLLIISLFNTSCNGCPEDINKDNVINVTDFLLYISEFNSVCH